MEDCIVLARTLGERVGRELEIPVFLYERAATRPDRENLADVRRGEFEGIRDEIGSDAAIAYPTSARRTIHPTAGAVGDRRAPLPRRLQRLPRPGDEPAGREGRREGGARLVRRPALREGTRPRGRRTGAGVDESRRHREDAALSRVRHGEDGSRGAAASSPTWSEIVGLVPERALFETAARHIQLRDFTPEMVLEHKVRDAVQGGESLSGFVASVASPTPTPGGGSVAAHVGALGAALAQMVAGLTAGKKKYAAVDAEMRELGARGRGARATRSSALVARDADAYGAVSRRVQAARRARRRRERSASAAIDRRAARRRRGSARDGARLRRGRRARRDVSPSKGNTNAVSDAGVAALLAEAGCRGAVLQRAHQRRVARRQVARRRLVRGGESARRAVRRSVARAARSRPSSARLEV